MQKLLLIFCLLASFSAAFDYQGKVLKVDNQLWALHKERGVLFVTGPCYEPLVETRDIEILHDPSGAWLKIVKQQRTTICVIEITAFPLFASFYTVQLELEEKYRNP